MSRGHARVGYLVGGVLALWAAFAGGAGRQAHGAAQKEATPSPAPAPPAKPQAAAPPTAMTSPAPPPPPAGPPSLMLQPGPLLGPWVHLRADHPRTALQVEDGTQWSDVCRTPCGITVDPSRVYRLSGGPFTPTDPFRMPRSAGHVTIDAHMGWKVRRLVGKIATPVGVGVILTGALLFYMGSRDHALLSQSTDTQPVNRTAYHVYGAGAMVAGLGLTLGGVLLWTGNASSAAVD